MYVEKSLSVLRPCHHPFFTLPASMMAYICRRAVSVNSDIKLLISFCWSFEKPTRFCASVLVIYALLSPSLSGMHDLNSATPGSSKCHWSVLGLTTSLHYVISSSRRCTGIWPGSVDKVSPANAYLPLNFTVPAVTTPRSNGCS